MVGRRGMRWGCRRASRGVRPPLESLHGAQAVTMFSQVLRPPRERGVTWSKVRSSPEPQYWQGKLLGRKTLNRVNAGGRSWATYCFSETTLGSGIWNDGEWINLS